MLVRVFFQGISGMEKKLKKRFIIVGTILFLLFGGLVAYHFVVEYFTAKFLKNYEQPPVTVNVLQVEPVTWSPTYSTVGSAVAIQGANVAPATNGIVTKILFNSGDIVKKNQVLVVLDPDIPAAQLQTDEATMRYDKITYERYQPLYQQGVLSAQNLDQAYSTYQASVATVAGDKATLAQKYIMAPFAGRVGIRSVSLGQYLNTGDVVTNIQQLNPIYVNFDLPEQFLQNMYIGQPIEVAIDTFPGMAFKGKITAFDAQVADNSKAITVQATLPNTDPKATILPGMQANVTVFLKDQGKVLAVPQEAINYSLYGNSVYVVTDSKDKKGNAMKMATAVPITPGLQEGNLVEVTGELKAGDLIVVDGLSKLQGNSSVTIVNQTSQS